MNAQKTRRSASVWLATATAALVAISGLAIAPTAAVAETATGLAVTGVNGAAPSAKWPNVAVNAGSKLTLTGTFPESFGGSVASGGYLQWCLKPAEGTRPAADTCDRSAQQWLSSEALGSPYNIPASGTVANGVWTFTAEMTPPSSIAGTECGADGAGECGIYFRPDHRFGPAVTPYDQFIPIRFASNLGEATEITASTVASASDPLNSFTVNVGASGIAFENNPLNTDTGSKNVGVYFALIEKGTFLSTSVQGAPASNVAYVPDTVTSTSATSTLNVQLSKLDLAKQYEVVSWRAHGNPSAERYLGATEFDLQTQLSEIQRQRIGLATNATVTSAAPSGLTISAGFSGAPGITIPAGSGAPGPSAGVYAALIEAGTITDISMSNPGIAQIFVPNGSISSGSGSATLTAGAADLDEAKDYEIAYWYAHSDPNKETFLRTSPLEISDQQWANVFRPTATAAKFTYSTARYNAGNRATVTVSSEAGTPTGKATVRVAGQTLSANLVNGTGTVNLQKPVKVGSHTATVTFANSGTGILFGVSKAEATLRVVKATPRVSAKLSTSTVKTNRNARVSVAVTIPGSLGAKASYVNVQVYDGKKRIKSARLNAYGKVNITLPKLKAGSHKIKVRVSSTTNTNVGYSATKTLRAVRA